MDEKGGGGGDGKNDSDDSRSTIAQHCQNGQTLSTINTNFLHSSSTRGDDDAAAEESSQDRGVQHKQQQQELVPERGQACSSNDQDGAAYDVQDETQRIEPIKLSNGQYGSGGGSGGDDQSKNGSLTGDTAEDGRPKGHLRKLCEESNQPLQEGKDCFCFWCLGSCCLCTCVFRNAKQSHYCASLESSSLSIVLFEVRSSHAGELAETAFCIVVEK